MCLLFVHIYHMQNRNNNNNDNSKLGWKLGLQSVTGALSVAFFLGMVYKSASLYHPQRQAILQLRNQRNKIKERVGGGGGGGLGAAAAAAAASSQAKSRQPLVDLSPLGNRPVRMLMLAAGTAGYGLYTPAFYIVSGQYIFKYTCVAICGGNDDQRHLPCGEIAFVWCTLYSIPTMCVHSREDILY